MDLDLRGGLVKKNARLSFRFSQHCYSRGPSVGEAIPVGWRIPEGPADKPRDRIFCLQRYAYSLQLVTHLDTLIQTNGTVQRSRHLNFFATTLVLADAAGAQVSVPYYIFLKARKKQDPNQPPRLDIFVESAYTDDPHIPGPYGVGAPVPLSVLLGQIWAAG
ncbi:MAG: hypothetical protein WBK19_17665 [Azonexus sp.]